MAPPWTYKNARLRYHTAEGEKRDKRVYGSSMNRIEVAVQRGGP